MSKFDELCQVYAGSRKAYTDYRDTCFAFAQSLVEALIGYLEIPEGQIGFVPVNREPDPAALYTLPGAMHLDEDTFWHFGVVITLADPSGGCPPQAVLLKLQLKQHEDAFGVRLGQDDEDFWVRPGYPQEMAAFMDHVFTAVKGSYERGLQQFLDQASTRKIGFSA